MTRPFAVRAYAALLRLGPEAFREGEADALAHVFEELVHESGGGSSGSQLRLLAAELPGLARLLASEWRDALGAALTSPPAHARPRRESMLTSLMHDVRGAARTLRRSPGFAAIAVLTLALGVGANTAIFSLVKGVLLEPLAFPESDRLVAVGWTGEQGSPTDMNVTTPGSFFDWQRGARSVTGLAAYATNRVTLTGLGDAQSLIVTASAGGLFDVLRVTPLLGRTLRTSDETYGVERVVVLSHGTWQRVFGGDRDVVGRRITLEGTPATVVGVMPPSFRFPDGGTELWTTFDWTPELRGNRDQYYLSVVGRLGDGATVEQLRAEMAVTAATLRRDFAQFNTGLRINVQPLQDVVVMGARTRLLLFMGAVGFVLLITCANLANLQLARAAVRRREMAVRQALGAARSRVTRQLLAESLLLSAVGAVAALGVGAVLLRWLVRAHVDILPRIEEVGLDLGVVAFTFAVALAAGVSFGLAPALQLARARSSEALRESERAGGVRTRGRNALVVSELALALMLLTGAGLLVRSAIEASKVEPGFDTSNLLTFIVTLGDSAVTRREATLERLRAIPGVEAADVVSQRPMTGRGIGAWFNIYSRPTPANEKPPAEAYRVVSPGYFRTVGIPLRRGRLLTDDDRRDNHPSVVVNEALARRYWPNGDPIGEEIYMGAPDNRIFERATIVGVVGDTRDGGLRADPIPEVFIPHAVMRNWSYFGFVVRTRGEPSAMVPAVRAAIREVLPNRPITSLYTMDDILDEIGAADRLALTLLATLAVVALLMAAIGVFGVLAYVVAQRRRELGIRLALGAAVDDVRRLVVLQGLRMAAAGIGLGLLGALALSRVMTGFLYGIGSTDPLTYAAVAVLLLLIALVASWLPAMRATRVDPMIALRQG